MKLFYKSNDQYEDVKIRRTYYINLYYGVLSNIVSNLFTYKNMDIILSNDLKKCFFSSHYVGAFKVNGDILFSPLEPIGSPNILGDFDTFKPLMYNKDVVRISEFILGCDKTMRTLSDKIICFIFANRLADLLISVDTAIIDSRINNIFKGTENQIKNMLLSWEKRNIGAPLTVKLENKDNFDIQVEQLVKPTMISDFYNGYREILNEFLSCLGVTSLSAPNKKERLVTGELNQYDGMQTSIFIDKYTQRQKFINEINEKYGTDFVVIPNVDISMFNEDNTNDPSQYSEGNIDDMFNFRKEE